MMDNPDRSKWLSQVCVMIGALTLAACGGGSSSVGSTPAPPPAPTPTPTPTPTPEPSGSFTTSEYNRSDGPSVHNAIAAWQAGATGQGVTIAVVDSGIDSDSPEFAGRLSSSSADVAASRGLDNADSDHGTRVAMVAAAARDNTGIMGIAWQATIMALRADRPGSCATVKTDDDEGGCKFDDPAIAAAVNRAVQSGARIINLSLGGSQPDPALSDAVGAAAAAGVVIVVSAGNDGDSTEADIDPNNPDPFATGLRAAGNGHVIIAGSVNDAGAFSAFSNRAGIEAQWFLSAQGERVCCVYENGVMKVETDAGGRSFVTLFSGTSFSAPQIAGAAALLLQAFPNLTGAQVVDLLLRSARDAGAAGTDTTFGRGVLDIANAFAPKGATSLAGTSVQVPLSEALMTGSSAMGDSLSRVALSTVVLDRYERAYGVNLGANLQNARQHLRLAPALASQLRQVSGSAGGASLAFSIDGRGQTRQIAGVRELFMGRRDANVARVLAGKMVMQLTGGQQLGLAFGHGADGLVAQVQGGSRPAFLIAGDPLDDFGFGRSGQLVMAWRRPLGSWGLTLSAERASQDMVEGDRTHLTAWRRDGQKHPGTTRIGLSVDRQAGPVALTLGLGWLGEEKGILGASLAASQGAKANSLFIDIAARWRPADRWQVGAAWRSGQTYAAAPGLLAHKSRLASNAWSFDVIRDGVFSSQGRLGIRVSQPLRVSGGGLDLMLPTGWNYATRSATFGERYLSLVPSGRETTGEVNLQQPLWGGWASASLYYRRQPGHRVNATADAGVGLSWNTGF